MKLFGRTGGYYLFWTGFVYFCICTYLAFTHTGHTQYASLGFVLALSVPLLCPPVARHFNMEPVMFDFFRRRTAKDYMEEASNVYKLPPPKLIPPVPEIVPPKEEPAKIFYRIGATDQNRVAFSMGQMEITMNREGCQQMIDQLTVFMNQLGNDDVEEKSNR